MKRLRFLLVWTVLVILNNPLVFAQETVFEEVLNADPGDTVQLNLRFGELITIRGSEEDVVSFKATFDINSGRLNDALILDIRYTEEGVYFGSDLDEAILKGGRTSDCPDDLPDTYSQSYSSDYIVCHRIVYELVVPRHIELTVETISADVEIRGLHEPMDIRAISGFVDVSWPAARGLDLSLNTVSGEAYSDLDALSLLNRQIGFPEVGYVLEGKLLSGGIPVRLETISGDIFLRAE